MQEFINKSGVKVVSPGQQIVQRLRDGELPQMVDWFNPVLLGKVGVRSVISATIGSYADQRPMQAMADDAGTEDALADRHDFSDPNAPDPAKRLTVEPDGSVWVDFIADLGDGFEATYAMAYLMASERLDVEDRPGGKGKFDLKAGEILIFGGDLAYPDATVKEYQDRCIQPYNLAFSTERPTRKLFFIAGNHDWYDGLAAFTSVFCAARDRVSRGLGKQIGGWRCQQRRSYFALKLPYDWWIWGVDIQLNDSLDDAQRDYFDLLSERTKPGDKVILVLHFPLWLHESYDILHEISMLARKHGAEVAAVLAGDLHHYSRYYSDSLGVHLITSGGGGAFAHPTHQLDNKIEVSWPALTGAKHRIEDPRDRPEFNRAEKEVGGEASNIDYTEKRVAVSTEPNMAERLREINLTDPASFRHLGHKLRSSHIYPSKTRSRLIALKNLVMPLRNRKFAFALGLIYFLYGWVYQTALPDLFSDKYIQNTANEVEAAKIVVRTTQERAKVLGERTRTLALEPGTSPDAVKVAGDLARIAGEEADAAAKVARAVEARLQYQKEKADPYANVHVEARKRWKEEGVMAAFKAYAAPAMDPSKFFRILIVSPGFDFLLFGLWIALIVYSDVSKRLPSLLRGLLKGLCGTLHTAAHLATLLVINILAQVTSSGVQALFGRLKDGATAAPDVLGTAASTVSGYLATIENLLIISNHFLVSVTVGGLVGGLILGLYWVLTSTLFGMHMDSFGALGVKDYKNFLRMRFEPDKLTIYAIGLDKVPGRRGWRAATAGEVVPTHNPQLLPVKPLRPHLIEPPIVIQAKGKAKAR